MAVRSPRRKVMIINGGKSYVDMFKKQDWLVVDNMAEADLIQFTGGADVTPGFYSEPRHEDTFHDVNRDIAERHVFNIAAKRGIPMAGICRGGQLLNVLCGGKMWQNVDGHNLNKTHSAQCLLTGEELQVSSTHHQMMRPALKSNLLMTATQSNCKERMGPTGVIIAVHNEIEDVEAVHYDTPNCLCFQPHPEFEKDNSQTTEKYFQYLDLIM